jgi:hypothetical protein
MRQFAIKQSIERVPGGMMIVPLLVGSLIATFFPGTPKFFGSFTGALFTGALPILAVFYVCMGASIDIKATPYVLKKGGVLFGTKVLMGICFGFLLGRLLGETPITSGMFGGLSALAVVAAMNDTNGGLYMALMGQYGRPGDVGAYTIMSLESGPFLAMGVAVVLVTGVALFFADRFTGGTGVAGVAAASTAGNAAAVPALVAAANPAYAQAAKSATILVAACVVVTSILVPLLTAWTAKRFGANMDMPKAPVGGAPKKA